MDYVADELTITQTQLPGLYCSGRLSRHALVYRAIRNQLGGGFGDQGKYPYAWAVLACMDGRPARVVSARGANREWSSLDRLERWLQTQGLEYWSVSNELEPIGLAAVE